MNTITKNIKNEDGTLDTVMISSNDNYQVNIDKNYVLANRINKKHDFGNTIFGSDIGIHSAGFASMVTIAISLAIAALVIMYFIWRI